MSLSLRLSQATICRHFRPRIASLHSHTRTATRPQPSKCAALQSRSYGYDAGPREGERSGAMALLSMAEAERVTEELEAQVAAMRVDYGSRALMETDVHPDPIVQFGVWLDEAVRCRIYEPNAMTLSTCTRDGFPSARMVLLKGFGPDGFKFFTNYESRKGSELADNPRAALVFWWGPLFRSVRIEGDVARVSAKESDEYFHSRPRGSQFGASLSHQSSVVASRDVLEAKMKELEAKYPDETEIPRPDFWGGYVVVPRSIEFWQGRRNRVHDRIKYTHAADGTWTIARLSP